jgi:hypothetical protein
MDDEQFLLQIFANIDEAEVLTIFFPLLRKALVLDTRHTPATGILLAVAPQVGSTAERLAWVRAARPEFGRPSFLMTVPWMKSIRSLAEQGVMARLRDLLIRHGVAPDLAATSTARAYAELVQIERDSFRAMLRGDGYDIVWQADE